jgi:ParB/RepB/Spo0J family partition protein
MATTSIDERVEVVQLRHLPLSRIVVPDGFNPRGRVVEDRELEQLAESMRRYGCLQPIRVRASDHGDYVLIAGERRYRAAVKAALMELPAIVRPAGSGDAEEEADLLIEAVLENDLRAGLDPVARARGYRRLLESGLTVKGVAERLATTQVRVREHVRILKLSEPAQAKLGAGEVPLRAVKPLEALTRIHPGLAAAAISQILDAGEDGYEPYTWADLERDPLGIAAAGELPEGVYRAYASYPLDAFTLSEQARKDLAALEKLIDTKVTAVRFEHDELEQARQLGAAHGEHSQPIIVGADVAGQLAGDYLARCVKVQQANQRRGREQQPSQTGHQDVGVDGAQASEEEARRAQRQADREARERAVAFNLELGRAVYTNLSRVKLRNYDRSRFASSHGTTPSVCRASDMSTLTRRSGESIPSVECRRRGL